MENQVSSVFNSLSRVDSKTFDNKLEYKGLQKLKVNRAYYSSPIEKFITESSNSILGVLVKNHPFSLDELQRNAWVEQIDILKDCLSDLSNSHIIFEYTIPRMGKRVDVIVLFSGIVFILEFKVGEKKYSSTGLEQVLDYAIDLKNFHERSHELDIIPILVSTEARSHELLIEKFHDNVYKPLKANKNNILSTILNVTSKIGDKQRVNPEDWSNSVYKPTPTIIEAAQALYKGHSVNEISRSDSGAINLAVTSEAIYEIIEKSKANNRKSICFITGVPGSGKTLAGLNIANERHNVDLGEHSVFLSGNGPLVEVLQEALARNEVSENRNTPQKLTKKQSLSKTKAFIQNIHHFRDDSIKSEQPPIEHVVVFDEAQRAWTREQTSDFMSKKKGILGFDQSEPEFLISILDRHQDWATIVCLIGGGQEINRGEAGLPEWFSAICKSYHHWDVYISDKISDYEYTNGKDIFSDLKNRNQLVTNDDLHLSVSVRSYRSEKISSLVASLLNMNVDEARKLFMQVKERYPIVLTRNINKAKDWLRSKARGSESMGVIASSGAYRLKPHGIHIKSGIDPKTWFLNDKSDVRSSGFLEEVATEFDIQGLELDWTCVAWDANFRKLKEGWEFKRFRGTEWQNVQDDLAKRYLLNSYRVLLTRARQGMVIFVPYGDSSDRTRLPEFYDPIYEYLSICGLISID